MQNDEQEIRDMIAAWLDASRAGDTERVLSMMSDDVVFLTCGQPPMRGKAAFAASQNSLKEFTLDATCDVQEVKVLGDWAFVWTHLSIAITPKGGDAMKRAGNTLSVLQKQNGSWVIVRDANMLASVSH